MAEEHDIRWADFEQVGEKEVRMRLGAQQYVEAKAKLAKEWLAYRSSLRSSKENEASLAEAKAANELARSANDLALSANTIALAASASAERSAVAALNNNRIAKAAFAVAIIAMITAAIGIFMK